MTTRVFQNWKGVNIPILIRQEIYWITYIQKYLHLLPTHFDSSEVVYKDSQTSL